MTTLKDPTSILGTVDPYGRSPKDIALFFGYKEIIEILDQIKPIKANVNHIENGSPRSDSLSESPVDSE